MEDCRVLGRDIFVIDKYFRIYFKNALKKYDLNATEAMVLLALYERGGNIGENVFDDIHRNKLSKSQEQIISDLQYDKAAMTRTMQSLESKGFVTRRANPHDSRSFLFTVTEKADQFKPSLLHVLRDWNQHLLCDIENLDVVSAAVRQMAQNAKQAVKGE
jgi:DNA-binding MarR family transcriptional regulator